MKACLARFISEKIDRRLGKERGWQHVRYIGIHELPVRSMGLTTRADGVQVQRGHQVSKVAHIG